MKNIQNENDWFNKSNSLYKAKRYEEAIHCYDQVLQLDPGNASIWNNRGLCFSSLKRHAEALPCYDKALEINPKSISAWVNRGISLESLGRFEEALQCFEKALDLDPKNAIALNNKIICESKLDHPNQKSAELENNRNRSWNDQENLISRDSKLNQNMPDLSTDASYQPGDIIGQKYEVHSILGKGGFGVVYLVFDRNTMEVYALKTFLDEYLADIHTRDLFRKEAGIWVELGYHPYLVRANFIDEISDRLYIAMEYISPNTLGFNTLADYLEHQPQDLGQNLRWAIQICYGMEYAHSKGIRAHRDIKPANIMICQDGTAKITDFGLASVLGTSLAKPGIKLIDKKVSIFMSGKTQDGEGFGTITHMAPEQFDNAANCDERSDIYAFGVVLFQMASGGQLPFNPPTTNEDSEQSLAILWQMMHHLHEKAPVPQLDSPLYSIILHCLEKEPDRRYQSFTKLRSDLESLLKAQNGEVLKPPLLKKNDLVELFNKGFSLDTLGRYEEAIRCYDQILKLNSRDSNAWNNKGKSLFSLRNVSIV